MDLSKGITFETAPRIDEMAMGHNMPLPQQAVLMGINADALMKGQSPSTQFQIGITLQSPLIQKAIRYFIKTALFKQVQ